MDNQERAIQYFKSVLKNVNPEEFLSDFIKWNPDSRTLSIYENDFQLDQNQKLFVIGTGKASTTMASAAEKLFGDAMVGGFIIAPPGSEFRSDTIQIMEGSHPLPDSKSVEASENLLTFVQKIPDESIVINMISGGTSALFCAPVDELNISEIRDIYQLLIQSGATIQEINTVRKVFSKVKGGQFLNYLAHTILIDLIISDVPDDDKRYIGSGPTTAQEISAIEAQKVLQQYSILDDLPHNARNILSLQVDMEEKQKTIKSTADFENHYSLIVSSASKVAQSTVDILENAGYNTTLLDEAWSGPVGAFTDHIIDTLEEVLQTQNGKTAIVFYGECTVEVTGEGLGGRNQELALRMAKRLQNYEQHITFLSAGTDGIDGPTEAAGAVVDQNTYKQAKEKEIDPEAHLSNNDSYHFFKEFGGHIITGPTGNNVMDIQILLIDN